ncbi:MAG: nucleoside hydrolase [Bacteroidales bacterium]|nr:nucleoside hydrolase [Bacteroidales bacterium]
MKSLFASFAALSLLLACGPKDPGTAILFETDLGNDVDDVLALDLVLKEGEKAGVPLLGVGTHRPGPTDARYLDGFLTWYGYPEIPVAESQILDTVLHDVPDYTAKVVALSKEDGSPLFACSRAAYEDPVVMHRRLLAGRKDGSVVFLSTGFATELARLLESGPDDISPLSGRELVAKKVRFLSIMCGSTRPAYAEFNVKNDIPAMQKVFSDWPGPIYVTPFEIGTISRYPARAIEEDFGWADAHPLVEAYKCYLPMPYDRPVWDVLAAAWIFHPEMFSLSPAGDFSIDEQGRSSFTPREGGCHHVLELDKAQADALVAYMVELSTQEPPRRAAKAAR